MRLLRQVADYVRVRGLTCLVKAAVHRFVFQYQRLLVLELWLDRFVSPPRRMCRSLSRIHIRRATGADVDHVMDLLRRNGYWRRRREFEEALGQESSFFIATHGACLIAYALVSRAIPSTCGFSKPLRLGPGCAYGVYAFVAPRYRGLAVYPALMVEVVRELSERGYKRILLVCDPRNRAALSSHRRVGMTVVQELRIVRVAGLSTARLRLAVGEAAGGTRD
jgi:ribosomal protein S18 acetylase RimI-like enzyme